MTLHPVILAGGSGTRMWPLSRESYPKQFLRLTGEHSLFQETVLRLDGMDDIASPLVVCNEEHRFLVAEHLRQLGQSALAIALEPVGRNTAPALTLAALMLQDEQAGFADDDPVMLVLPADHVIRDGAKFRTLAQFATELAEGNTIVTFGIVPDSPRTGYGYIRKGQAHTSRTCKSAFQVAEFVEKPSIRDAERMLASETYLWNSGMFVLRPSVWLRELRRLRPDIADACLNAYSKLSRDGDFYRPDAGLFADCPSESIDYAVMEHIANGASPHENSDSVVVPMDVGWTDLGAWTSLWEESPRDANENVVKGDVYARAMSNSLLISERRLVAAVGLQDIILIETADAVLAAHRDHVQDVKELVEQLKVQGRAEQKNHLTINRPWGSFETIDAGERFQVKRLTIRPGEALSLQMHHHRAEHWVVVKGTAKVTRGEDTFLLTENQSTYVPVGVEHRLENPGTLPLEVIEVQTGSYLEEDDIVRFEDRYQRHILNEDSMAFNDKRPE